MTRRHWEDWINLVLGVWLFVSPWILHFIDGPARQRDDFFVIGPMLALLAFAALYMHRIWEERVSLLLGLWMVMSPWILSFNYAQAPTFNSILVGTIVGALAISAIEKDKAEAKAARDRDELAAAH